MLQVSNLLLVNLAVTDLMSSVLVMAVSVYAILADLQDINHAVCQLQCAANYCLIIVSMVTLACISLDRYSAVLWPLRYNVLVTRRRVLVLMCWPWVQGVLFAAAPVWMGWVHYDYWEAVCAIRWQDGGRQVQYYVIIACILCFLVPGGIMLFCYAHIIKQARQCHKHIHPMPKSNTVSSNFKQALKTITSLLVVVLVFFICMTPFCLTKLLKVVVSTNYIPGYVNLASSYLEYFASVANPFIYGIFRRDFRFAYRRVLHHLSCKLIRANPGSFQESIETMKAPGRVSNYTMQLRRTPEGEVVVRDPSPSPSPSPQPLAWAESGEGQSGEGRVESRMGALACGAESGTVEMQSRSGTGQSSGDTRVRFTSRPCSVSSIHGELDVPQPSPVPPQTEPQSSTPPQSQPQSPAHSPPQSPSPSPIVQTHSLPDVRRAGQAANRGAGKPPPFIRRLYLMASFGGKRRARSAGSGNVAPLCTNPSAQHLCNGVSVNTAVNGAHTTTHAAKRITLFTVFPDHALEKKTCAANGRGCSTHREY